MRISKPAFFVTVCAWLFAATLPRGAGAEAAAAREPRDWTLWVAPGFGTFEPSGFYRPITEGPDYAYSLHANLARGGSRWSLRFDLALHGNSASYDDTTVTYEDGSRWPYGSIDAFVGNTETWTALGIQWNGSPGRGDAYAFVSGGRLSVRPHAEAGARDLVVHDLPALPDGSSALGYMLGAGMRRTFGRHRTHALYGEAGWMRTMPVTYVGQPAAGSNLATTSFPVERSSAIAWNLRVGYAYAFRFGRGR